jgi:hypothetical protein
VWKQRKQVHFSPLTFGFSKTLVLEGKKEKEEKKERNEEKSLPQPFRKREGQWEFCFSEECECCF